MPTRKHQARMVAALRSERAAVHAGVITLDEYHRIVDRTAQQIPLPPDVLTWGRSA